MRTYIHATRTHTYACIYVCNNNAVIGIVIDTVIALIIIVAVVVAVNSTKLVCEFLHVNEACNPC